MINRKKKKVNLQWVFGLFSEVVKKYYRRLHGKHPSPLFNVKNVSLLGEEIVEQYENIIFL